MPDASGLGVHVYAPSRLLEAACRDIVARHAPDVPDLTRVVVLVPHLRARHAIASCLRLAAGTPVLLLPRITTLRAWTEEIPLDRRIAPAVVREALLYRALSVRRWFEHADLWVLAAELSDLFDELTRWHVGMPHSVADFQLRLERAYRVRSGASFAFEARLIYELWHTLGQNTEWLDAEAAYQLRLGVLAEKTESSVYAIGLERLTPSERQFLDRCAGRTSVEVFVAQLDPDPQLTPIEHALAHAWPEQAGAPLAQRAAGLRAVYAAPPLLGRLTFCGAHGIEQEARAIDLTVRRWLHEGCRSIAVVVLDRLVARRARALLERARILVRDEVGWAFSTTSAATAISRWLDACDSAFSHRDLLDLLKSPFVFAAWDRTRRQVAVWRLESSIRRESVSAGIENYLALVRSPGDVDAREMLLALQRAVRVFEGHRRKSIGGWLHALDAVMRELGIAAGFEADAAGMQLRRLLQTLAADVADDGMRLARGEFRRWMQWRLESATFRDAGIESPVVFTSLETARLRRFDAALLCGADEAHLSGGEACGLFFNQNVRRELGLPGQMQAVREMEAALFALIAATPRVCVTWQHTSDGDPNLLAPAFERLRTLHTLAWGEVLDDPWLRGALGAAQECPDLPAQALERPAPAAPGAALPTTMSASAYNALMACPYRFFARYVLRLRECDEVQEEVDKSDHGNLVHESLHQFHSEHPSICEIAASQAHEVLLRISRTVFAGAISTNYLARAWLMRWQRIIPKYLHWQRAREAQGWRFSAGEAWRSIVIETPAGRRLELAGRIDRIDRHAGGSVSVLDYKTRDRAKLRAALKIPGEEVQLAVYRALCDGTVDEAMFLALDGEEVESVRAEDGAALATAVRDRLGVLFDRIADGAPLPAQGTEEACLYCEFGGLCRRKYWS